MLELLTLTRAARLVGVTRGSLQKKIKHGELATFEGMIALTELLRAYPEVATRLTDDSMLERVKELKDNALTKAVSNRVVLPDAQTLATRVTKLSQELAKAKTRLGKYTSLVDRLKDKLSELEQTGDTDQRSAFSGLNAWLSQALQEQPQTTDLPERLLVKDSLLRIMEAQVKVLPSGHEFLLEGTDTILEAALRAGLAVNYGCSNGNCGLCKARIVSGEVKKIGHHDYVLSAAEKAQGYELLCANTAVTDLVIEALEAGGAQDIPAQHIETRVKKTERLSDDVMLVHLQTPRTKRLRFLAGQYVSLEASDGLTENFPIASCPCDDRNLQFHIRKHPETRFSNYVFTELKDADTVSVDGPKGEFVLQEDSPRSIIFVACDTGFSPIKSLIEHAMALDMAESMHLYWIAYGDGGHYLHNLCRSWTDALDNFEYTPLNAATDERAASGPGHKEPVHQDHLIEGLLARVTDDYPDLGEHDVYVAGPESIANTAEFFFLNRGLPQTQLFIEYTH